MAVDKLVDSTQLDAALTATANAIRSKTGSAVSLPWNLSTGFAAAVESIPAGGDTSTEDGLVTRTLSQYTNSRVQTIGDYAFLLFPSLVSVNFPSCATIGQNAFQNCTSLENADFPSCTDIGYSAFHGCSALQSLSFPACTGIGISAFAVCTALSSVYFPACTTIGAYAFTGCTALSSVYFPAYTSISSRAFQNCFKLVSLYLLNSSVCGLAMSNAFASTPIAGYSASAGRYGSIYVPASLLTVYKSSTNWAYFSIRFVGLTDAQLAELGGESA